MKSLSLNCIVLALLCFVCVQSRAQINNNDQNKGAISVTLPKTPESEAFETYGKIPVSELTGNPNISVPIYTLKSRFLEVPITLSYAGSGIKVSEEASNVGLGFNLNMGGRITVETRGFVDNDGTHDQLYAPSLLKYGMQKLFNRLGGTNGLSVLTYGSTCNGCDTALTNNIPDHWGSINAMAQYGLGEADIFRANFMGNSLKFYFNKITDSLEFIGDKSLFHISETRSSDNKILTWTVTDNSGVKYFFNTREVTTMTMPPMGALDENTSTTAWLLSKILHPAGDSVVFTYNNYGLSYPVSPKSASITYMAVENTKSYSDDNFQNEIIQQPQYLTRVESNAVAVEFILANREDLKGPGSKRVNEIRVIDKSANKTLKRATFAYAYFNSSLSDCYSSLHDSISKYYRLRLKLTGLTVRDSSSLLPPYKFFYDSLLLPNKLSMAIDHWGYYNNIGDGSYMDPCSPKNLLPNTGLGTTYNDPDLNGYAASRVCSPSSMQKMMLDSIVYPTGGSTKFIFEPHVTTSFDMGGGLRIKSIRNYNLTRLINSVDYTYSGGTYLGAVMYHTTSHAMMVCPTDPVGSQKKENLSSNGAINDADLLVAYSTVKITERNERGKQNGYTYKYFNVPNPRYSTGGHGFDLVGAHWPSNGSHGTDLLYAGNAGFPPTPTMQLDGKLMKEEFYDNSNTLLKSVNYHYTQTDYSEKFFSVRAIDTRIGGADAVANACGGGGTEFEYTGARRYVLFVQIAKSFFTVTDSVVERTYHGNHVITNKKAFKYNPFFQQIFQTQYNSDGTQTITYTKNVLDFQVPGGLSPTGDAAAVNSLKSLHIYDLPIEQTTIIRTVAGDSLVTYSRVNIYDKTLLQKVYVLEHASPIAFRSGFIPAFYNYSGHPGTPPISGSCTLKLDDAYSLYSTAKYGATNLLMGISSREGLASYVWDDHYNTVLAQCTNADTADAAFSSFETSAKGRWIYNQANVTTETTAPTGSKAYNLAGGNISIGGLSSTKAYVVTYWSKSGSVQSVTSSSSSHLGLSSGTWRYIEQQVNNPAGGTITISGSAVIDELRLFPKSGQMTSNTYKTLGGIATQSDPSGRIAYYEYDGIDRLILVRNLDKSIIKKIDYKYGDIFQYTYGNDAMESTAAKSCPSGYASYVGIPYRVPANTYGSYLNLQDANTKAKRDVDENGQAWADSLGICNPTYTFTPYATFFNGMFSSFSVPGSGVVSFQFAVSKKSGTMSIGTSLQVATLSGLLFVPSANRVVTVNEGGHTWEITFTSTGSVYAKLTADNDAVRPSIINVSGTYNL